MFENDSSFITINRFYVDRKRQEVSGNRYYEIKDKKFKEKDISTEGFENFVDRPSLKNMSRFLEGTIYTYTCEKKNGKSYKNILESVSKMISKNSRRAVVTISDRFLDYENSEINRDMDVSCLNTVHYMKDKVTLFFRASDIENELLIDIVTVFDHFIKPIYKYDVKIDLMLSTCQNIDNFLKILL